MINPLTYQLQAIRTVAFGSFDVTVLIIDFLLTLAQCVLCKIPLKLSTR